MVEADATMRRYQRVWFFTPRLLLVDLHHLRGEAYDPVRTGKTAAPCAYGVDDQLADVEFLINEVFHVHIFP
jgi:hypothetical protein